MVFEETNRAGVLVVRPQPRPDERGHFARMYCERELAERGLVSHFTQINTGFSPLAGTLRGMHHQKGQHAEVKIARCVRGVAFDVCVDLRPKSPTYKRWFGIELSADNGLMLYAPAGTAHGYLTLAPQTELLYLTSKPYVPDAAHGVRFDDPAFAIALPAKIALLSQADSAWPDFA